jgi:hypothetical protein
LQLPDESESADLVNNDVGDSDNSSSLQPDQEPQLEIKEKHLAEKRPSKPAKKRLVRGFCSRYEIA